MPEDLQQAIDELTQRRNDYANADDDLVDVACDLLRAAELKVSALLRKYKILFLSESKSA